MDTKGDYPASPLILLDTYLRDLCHTFRHLNIKIFFNSKLNKYIEFLALEN